MPRQQVSDITPRRTIRDIPVPRYRQERPQEMEPPPPPPPPPPPDDMRRRRRFGFSRRWVIIVGVLVLALLGLLASQLLSVHATMTVTQKTKDVSVSGTFIGKKDAKDDELPFDTISASKEGSKTVPATGEKQVETRASGSIVIYNNYSTAPQRLIKNTRFETANGRIYRIDQSVTVPGKDASTGTPGSIETVVYADTAGVDYNIGLSDFTIPGFKGDPRYSKFFARSKTPMTGGFIGKIKTASVADLAKAKGELETELRSEVTKSVREQIPAQVALFDNALYIDFVLTSPPDSNEIKEKATAYAVVFDKKKIASAIALATVPDYDKSEGDVEASPLQSLTFKPVPPDAKPWESGVVSFSLEGTTTIVWQFDSQKLKDDLAGQPKNSARIATILQAYPSITHADVVVRPFWRSSLPDTAEKIDIVTSGK